METLVLAVGGNALLRPGDRGTAEEQFRRARETAESIYPLFAEYKVVVTHGNGPQVGAILLQNEYSQGIVPPMPLDVCGAMSQGQIGYMLGLSFHEVLMEKGVDRDVVAILTRVLVDERDSAFTNPTKPIGPFYTREEAEALMKEKGWAMIEDSGRGWRRVVPSPQPLRIVEREVIRRVIDAGFVAIAVGGGGIPVIRKNGRFVGVEAVIDKDLASATLGKDIGADKMFILTSVPQVYLNFGRPDQKPIEEMSVEEAKRYMAEGHFRSGSMLPKIQAAIRFIEGGGREVLITSPEALMDALDGGTGTWIRP